MHDNIVTYHRLKAFKDTILQISKERLVMVTYRMRKTTSSVHKSYLFYDFIICLLNSPSPKSLRISFNIC